MCSEAFRAHSSLRRREAYGLGSLGIVLMTQPVNGAAWPGSSPRGEMHATDAFASPTNGRSVSGQYSSGKSSVVADRSASVMIHGFSPAFVWKLLRNRNP